jgi:O-antigen/teichoic acid export membrane protein
VLANLGLDTILHREFATGRNAAATVFSAALYLRLAGSMVATCAFLLIAFTAADAELRFVFFGVAFINLQPVAAVNELWLQAHGWNGPAARTQLLILLGGTLLRVVLVLQECTVVAFAWVFAFESLLSLVLYSAMGRRCGLTGAWRRFPGTTISRLLRECLPMLGAVLGAALYQKIDLVLVNHFCTAHTAGNYGAAVRLTEPVFVLPLVLATVVAPRLARLRRRDKQSYDFFFANYLAISVGLGVLTAVCTTLLAPFVLPILFGDSFRESVGLLQIRTWVVPFLCCEICRSVHLVQLGRTRLVLGAQLVGVITIVTIGPILTNHYGASGAAISAVLAMAAAGWGSCWLSPRTIRIGRMFVVLLVRPDRWVSAGNALVRDDFHFSDQEQGSSQGSVGPMKEPGHMD